MAIQLDTYYRHKWKHTKEHVYKTIAYAKDTNSILPHKDTQIIYQLVGTERLFVRDLFEFRQNFVKVKDFEEASSSEL